MRESEINEQKQILIERLKGGLTALRIENPTLTDKQLFRKLVLGMYHTRKLMRRLNVTLKDLGIVESSTKNSSTRKRIKRTVMRDSSGKLCVRSTEY